MALLIKWIIFLFNPTLMHFFWILWGFDALISLVILYFFFVGLADGTVSSFNIRIWLLLLGAVAVIMLGSLWLRAHHYLGLLAIPGLMYVLYMLMILLFKPRWN